MAFSGGIMQLTAFGRRITAQAQAGGTITYKSIALGDGYPASGVQDGEVSQMQGQKLTFPILTRQAAGSKTILRGNFSPGTDVEEEFTLREMGITALDESGQEALAAYISDSAATEIIAPDPSQGVRVLKITVDVKSSAAELSAPPDAYLTLEEVQGMIENISYTVDTQVLEGSENPVAGGAVKAYVDNAAKEKVDIAGGEMTGALIAGGTQDGSAAQVRNITYGTEDLIAGESPLATGQVHLVYE